MFKYNPLLENGFQESPTSKAPGFHKTSMNFEVDNTGIAIKFIDQVTSGVIDVRLVNTIEAVENAGGIKIQTQGGTLTLIDRLVIANTYINTVQVTQVLATAVQALNNLFANAGTGTSSNPPVQTSPTTINLTVGGTVNYTLAGTNAVAYAWSNLPTGISAVNGNNAQIIGGSGLAQGTYTFTARIINYYGQSVETITLNVNAAFINTKSFNGRYGVGHFANTSAGHFPMEKTVAGSSGPAWTMFWWQKWNHFATNGQHVVLRVGRPVNQITNRGQLRVAWFRDNVTTAGSGVGQHPLLYVQYGAHNLMGNLVMGFTDLTINNSSAINNWHSCMLVYTGADTGQVAADVPNYLNAFRVFVDGTELTTRTPAYNYANNNGFNGTILSTDFACTIQASNTNSLKMDEMAFFDSDRSADASTLHNAGAPLDLLTYSPLPTHYYRFGDGTQDISGFPTMSNMVSGGGTDMTMSNGAVSDYVSDVP